MTAYANIYKRKKAQTIQVTLRSANFKYLDISIHDFPAQNILLEEQIKEEIKKKITRGKIEVYVYLKGHIESVFYRYLILRLYPGSKKFQKNKLPESKYQRFLSYPGGF
jgi:uncharacterized protein YicC (UPF0701 family)